MARIMLSCAGKYFGDAAILDFADGISPEIGMAILFTEIRMAACPHTMKAKLADGRAYCCDCGKIVGDKS